MSEQKSNVQGAYTPVLVLLLIVGSFFLGRLSLEVANLKKDKVTPTPTADAGQQAAPERTLDVPSLKEKAKSLGMNGDFDTCLDSGKYASRVAAETKEGQNFGVSGTPSFLINGLLVVGAQPQESFEKIIDAELKNGGGAVAAKELGEDGKRNKVSYGTGPVFGPANAKIKIVEFTDFECPFCERAFPTISAVLKKYEGNISMEYKSFPLPFHSKAQKAAEAALCANDQGKFWEMHDLMFAPAK
jgi:protein-disulfide isomerase